MSRILYILFLTVLLFNVSACGDSNTKNNVTESAGESTQLKKYHKDYKSPI